jgi:acylpyruvate hydrolase
MKLATARIAGTAHAVRVDGDTLVDLDAHDLGEFLSRPGWRDAAARATSPSWPASEATLTTLIPHPSKVICVGLNYRRHIAEMGREMPQYPTLFAKFADTLIGPTDAIVRPAETQAFDWEVELAIVIGARVRRADATQAEHAIAGFTVLNDITCRDWQARTNEWLQGKNWEATTPVGPHLVTPDELPGGVRPELAIRLTVDGVQMQSDTTADLIFGPVELVRYISTMTTLNPGDIIATGTPAGVGHARRPPRYLLGGETVVAEIDGIGQLRNRVVAE